MTDTAPVRDGLFPAEDEPGSRPPPERLGGILPGVRAIVALTESDLNPRAVHRDQVVGPAARRKVTAAAHGRARFAAVLPYEQLGAAQGHALAVEQHRTSTVRTGPGRTSHGAPCSWARSASAP